MKKKQLNSNELSKKLKKETISVLPKKVRQEIHRYFSGTDVSKIGNIEKSLEDELGKIVTETEGNKDKT